MVTQGFINIVSNRGCKLTHWTSTKGKRLWKELLFAGMSFAEHNAILRTISPEEPCSFFHLQCARLKAVKCNVIKFQTEIGLIWHSLYKSPQYRSSVKLDGPPGRIFMHLAGQQQAIWGYGYQMGFGDNWTGILFSPLFKPFQNMQYVFFVLFFHMYCALKGICSLGRAAIYPNAVTHCTIIF